MKKIIFKEEARYALQAGVDLIANAVKVTLGAKGRTVIIGRDYNQAPHVTKDGVTVARAVEANDPIEAMGTTLLKMVAQKTAMDAGDGTTTACVLAQAIIREGLNRIDQGVNVVDMKVGIDMAVAMCTSVIKSCAQNFSSDSYEDLYKVALVSANGDQQIAQLIAETMVSIGRYGVIHVEQANSSETKVVIEDGMEFARGFITPSFINDGKGISCEFENPYILVCAQEISEVAQIWPILSDVSTANKMAAEKGDRTRSLFIICNEMNGEALKTLATNAVANKFRSCVVRAPGFGSMKLEVLKDIAILCGTDLVSDMEGKKLSQMKLKDLGGCKIIRADKDKTVIIGSDEVKEKVADRILLLRAQIEATPIAGEKDQLNLRAAKLSGGVARLSVGGNSDMEAMERRDRIDDASCATRSALEEGVVPGGGTIYLWCLRELNNMVAMGNADMRIGVEIVKEALKAPYSQILINAGMSPIYNSKARWFSKAREEKLNIEYGVGVNVRTGEMVDMKEAGIVDPAKVSRVALENAASVAGTFLTTECVIGPVVQEV